MTDRKHQRQATVIALRPTFKEDSATGSCHSYSTDFSEPSPAPVEEYADRGREEGRRKYYEGSVFSLARRIGGRDEEEDDSSVASGGVEVIVSELENLTQVSDSSLQLSARECDDSESVLSVKLANDELKSSMKSVQEATFRQAAERVTERKEALSQVLAQVRTTTKAAPRPDNEIAIKAALMRLIPVQSAREAAIRSVSKAQTRHLYLQIADGKVQGVYGLDRTALRKLFGGQSRGEFVTFSAVKRWFRLEGLGFKVVFGYQYRHADAFEI